MPTRSSSDAANRRSGKLTGDEDFDGLKRVEPTLPGKFYWDRAHHDLELARVFHAQWLFVCHESALAKPGQFRVVTIGTQSVIVLRDHDLALRAFHNTCRHRGSALCLGEAGTFDSKLIRCPYHQWAYAMDGRLVATTSRAEAPDFDKASYSLFSVHLRQWRGCIFISLADDPADLESTFDRGSDRIDNWPLEKLRVGHTWRKTMQCNWKVFWENFNECLHCPNIHPELCDLVPIYGRRISGVRDAHDWLDHLDSSEPKYQGGLRAGAESWSCDGTALPDGFEGLTPDEIARGQMYFISLPSVFIAAHKDYMRTVRILPLGPEETAIDVEWLFSDASLERGFDMANITDFAIMVMEQDARASELNQRGLRSMKYEHGVLMPEEHYVKSFHDWVRAQLS